MDNFGKQDIKALTKKVLEKLTRYVEIQEYSPSSDETENNWKLIEGRIYKKSLWRRRILIGSVSLAAAISAIVIMIFVDGYRDNRSVFDSKSIAALAVENNSSDIQLVLSDEESIKVEDKSTVRYSDKGEIDVDNSRTAQAEASKSEKTLNEIIVPKGKHVRVILSDGSILYVNSDSKVIFPRKFETKKREIFVEGEIYIDVCKKERSSFIVKTADYDVTVLGTAFDVKAYGNSEENSKIVLLRGLVEVKNRFGSEIRLAPDEMAILNADGTFIKEEVNAADCILWTRGIMPLNKGRVSDIAKDISRYYGVKIICSPEIGDISLSGKINLDGGIDDALKNLAITGGFRIIKDDDGYSLEP